MYSRPNYIREEGLLEGAELSVNFSLLTNSYRHSISFTEKQKRSEWSVLMGELKIEAGYKTV
jgi:hypothetical protein